MTMRLPEFLDKIDSITQKLTTEELLNLVHQIARTLPEDERDSFLELIISCTESKPSQNQNQALSNLSELLANLDQINQANKYLTFTIDDEWDSWHDDYEEQFIYYDKSFLLEDINIAVSCIHQCIDLEYYDPQILKLIQALSCLTVTSIENDEYIYEQTTMSLQDLYHHNLLPFDLNQFIYESMYLIYRIVNEENRPNEIYNFIQNFDLISIKLENLMQIGNQDLPNFDIFLIQWIQLLINQEESHTHRLINDATLLLKNPEDLLVFAKEHAKTHPYLYLHFFENYSKQYSLEQLLQISLKALEDIPKQFTVRSKIALYYASFANQTNDFKNIDQAYFEAFVSDTTIINYMRLRFESHNYQKYKNPILKTIQSLINNTPTTFSSYSGLCINSITRSTKNIISFFETDFSKESISKFQEIPLYFILLTLNNKDVPPYKKGLEYALSCAFEACDFNAKVYYFGTFPTSQLDSYELFIKLFTQWKQNLQLSKNEENLWFQYLDSKIQAETESTLSNHHRSHYYSCAALISAYGEVLESRNQKGSKQQLIDSYKKKYPRFRAFHSELNKFIH